MNIPFLKIINYPRNWYTKYKNRYFDGDYLNDFLEDLKIDTLSQLKDIMEDIYDLGFDEDYLLDRYGYIPEERNFEL